MITAREARIQRAILRVLEEQGPKYRVYRSSLETGLQREGWQCTPVELDRAFAAVGSYQVSTGIYLAPSPLFIAQQRERIAAEVSASLDHLVQAMRVVQALESFAVPPAWAACLRVEQARECYSGRVDNLRGVIAYPVANMSANPW